MFKRTSIPTTILLSLTILVLLVSSTAIAGGNSKDVKSILVYSGAGLKKPMDEIGRLFEEKTGIDVRYNYAGSNTLLSQIELVKEGDVYMPGATYYIETADEKGLIDKQKMVAYHTPVIAVPEGNPKNIQSLKDLTETGVEVVWGDPGACAIGRLGNKILKKNGIFEAEDANVVSRAATVNEIVVNLAMNQADAGMIWKANLHGVGDKTDYIMIAEENNIIKKVPIGSLAFSKKKEAAKQFVEFVGDTGKDIFEKYGFIKYEE